MRTAARVLTGVAVAALLIGIGWAFVNRASTDTTTPALLLVVGVVAAVDATAFLVLAERDADGLRVGAARLPAPMWWPPLLAAGLVGLVGGLWISVPVAVLGAVVLLAAGVGAVRQLLGSPREPGPTDRRTARAADAQVRSSASRAGSIVGVGRRRADRTGSGAARARRAGRDPR